MIEVIAFLISIALGALGVTVINNKLHDRRRERERRQNEKWLEELTAEKKAFRDMDIHKLVETVNSEREKEHRKRP